VQYACHAIETSACDRIAPLHHCESFFARLKLSHCGIAQSGSKIADKKMRTCGFFRPQRLHSNKPMGASAFCIASQNQLSGKKQMRWTIVERRVTAHSKRQLPVMFVALHQSAAFTALCLSKGSPHLSNRLSKYLSIRNICIAIYREKNRHVYRRHTYR
jgi:hypothetical protein